MKMSVTWILTLPVPLALVAAIGLGGDGVSTATRVRAERSAIDRVKAAPLALAAVSTPATTMCGSSVCAEIDLGGTIAPPCCPPEDPNSCGAMLGCLCLTTTAPAAPDPTCGNVTLPGFPPLPGCCTAAGICGADLAPAFGCNYLPDETGAMPIPCGPAAGRPPHHGESDTSPI